jgi:ribosome-binding protein aMBF1 (putative translation factor)
MVPLMRDPSGARRARFEALYAAHGCGVLAYALRRTSQPADAADVLAEAFLVAWRLDTRAQRRRRPTSEWTPIRGAHPALPDTTPRRQQVPFLIRTDNLRAMATSATTRRNRSRVASPVGQTTDEAAARRASRSPEYRAQQASLAGCREIAWLLIKFRMDKGLSQQQLANLVGTSNSQISRIESGRHRTNLDTLTRIAHALGLRLVLGFETASTTGEPKRELVAF